MLQVHRVCSIREELLIKLERKEFVEDKTGVRVVEIVGASFLADEPTIFGKVNEDYVKREIAWYESQSLNVNDIPPPVPEIWKKVASSKGEINSNYGWAIFSEANGSQYKHVLEELKKNPSSRRAEMIYTRPTMWSDYNRDGMSDFMCTNAVQYMIRDRKLIAVVQMRSNDAVFGFKNDRAWAQHIQQKLANDLSVEPGDIIWHVGSLHVYERHWCLVRQQNNP